MKKLAVGAGILVATFAAPAQAADMDFERELGLIVSGVVDKWAGVQFIDDGFDDDTVFATGGEGRLSLPLAENMSIQMDLKYEYNSNALEDPADNDVFGPRYSYQGTLHGSWRDPSSFLIGAFGGAGTYDVTGFDTTAHFVGGEAQIYAGEFTFYGQGGYVEFNPDSSDFMGSVGLDDGFFARGVVRWFPTPDSRLQLEGTYINAEFANMQGTDYSDVDIWSVGDGTSMFLLQ